MIKIENDNIYGWDAAIRGMRNPMNSWSKSDSTECVWVDCGHCQEKERVSVKKLKESSPCFFIGENDLKLMRNLAKAGTDHSKFTRMITVTCDITAPLYYWKQFDTYKVGTTTNSCSTMHKIQEKEFTLDDFSYEHLVADGVKMMEQIIEALNDARELYNNFDYYEKSRKLHPAITSKKMVWWQMIQLLPSSYNQRRTVQLNYEVLRKIYFARKNHKLDEWHTFCDWIESLPYFKEIFLESSENE